MVGAGPSGLLLALLLSKHGVSVDILEAEDHLDQQPRAAIYGTPAIPEFHRAGILGEIRRRGMVMNKMAWRRYEDYSVIAGFDNAVLEDVDGLDLRTSTLVLPELDQMMLDLSLSHGSTISWEHKVVDVGQDGEKAWADVETKDGMKRVEADYIVGCDGANSTVRKCVFGKDFPGFTWDTQIVATNVRKDLGARRISGPHQVSLADVSDRIRCTMISRENLAFTTPILFSTPSTSLYVPPSSSPSTSRSRDREVQSTQMVAADPGN